MAHLKQLMLKQLPLFAFKALAVFWGWIWTKLGEFCEIKFIAPLRDLLNAHPLIRFWSVVIIMCICLAVYGSMQAYTDAWSI